MTTVRTSKTHPLDIAAVDTPGGGRIGLTFCPGKCDLHAMTGPCQRDLSIDLRRILEWGAPALVTLLEPQELTFLRVAQLGERARALGLEWLHLPIRDGSIPGAEFEQRWPRAGARLRDRLERRQGVVVHCRGGLGRTGLVAARLLVELGEPPERALARVREARPDAVETSEQESYVLGLSTRE